METDMSDLDRQQLIEDIFNKAAKRDWITLIIDNKITWEEGVKNRKRPVNISQVLQESFLKTNEEQPRRKTRGSSKKGANPLRTTPPGPKFLFMLLGLDAGKTGLEVSISQRDDPIIWAIQSYGHDKIVFRCLENLGVETAALRFFKVSSAETPGIGFVLHKDQLYNILHHDSCLFVVNASETYVHYNVREAERFFAQHNGHAEHFLYPPNGYGNPSSEPNSCH